MRIHHLALRTRNVERLRVFYTHIVGLVEVRDRSGGVWLDADGTVVMIEEAIESEPLPSPTSMELIAFAIEPEEKSQLLERLDANSCEVESRTDYTLYVRDPDGRRIAFSHYPTMPTL